MLCILENKQTTTFPGNVGKPCRREAREQRGAQGVCPPGQHDVSAAIRDEPNRIVEGGRG